MNSTLLPRHVLQCIAALKQTNAVNEIWLIGSRANGTAHPESDWDILVKAISEPLLRIKEYPDIDVVWCGPFGSCLAEGAPEYLRFHFSDFEWAEAEGKASYLGRKFTDNQTGVARDASEPAQVRERQRAFRLWIAEHASEQRESP